MLRFSLRGIASKPPAVRRSRRGGPRSARSVELVVVASLVLGSAQAHVEPEPNAPSRNEDARDEDARDEATRNDPALREAMANEPTANEAAENEASTDEPSREALALQPGAPGARAGRGCIISEYAARTLSASVGVAWDDSWNLTTNGTLSTEHAFVAGEAIVSVVARGQPARGQWPRMTVLVGDEVVGVTRVDTPNDSSYDFLFTVQGGARTLSVRFDNDYYRDGEDRNLVVASVIVDQCLDAPQR